MKIISGETAAFHDGLPVCVLKLKNYRMFS